MSEVRECSKRVGTWHCMVLTRLPGGLCSAHQPKAATRRNRALAAARDELVRAAVALNAAHSDIALAAPVDPTSAVVSRRLAWSDFRAAVAAYEKLAGGA